MRIRRGQHRPSKRNLVFGFVRIALDRATEEGDGLIEVPGTHGLVTVAKGPASGAPCGDPAHKGQ